MAESVELNREWMQAGHRGDDHLYKKEKRLTIQRNLIMLKGA